jgi:hypothetical protein
MSIDSESDSTTTQASNATTEPADTASHAEPQDSGSQDAGESPNAAPETDQQADDSGSSTSSDTTLQTADPKEGSAPAEPKDWAAEKAKYEKRIADLRANHGRASNELHQYRQRFKDIDPDAARKALALSQQQQVPVWSAKHPENRSFRETVAAFGRYEAAMRKADTPEKRAIAQELFGSTFTEKEVQQLQEWRAHQMRETERMASDPDAYREKIRAEVQEQIREEMRASREEAEVASWFGNRVNQPIVEKYREEMITLMNEGWHWPQVQRYIEAKAKADGLQSRVGSADKTAAAARAQQAAQKTAAKATRDPAQAPVGKLDFAKIGADYAKKNGLPLNHERVMAHVEKAVANWRASQPEQTP